MKTIFILLATALLLAQGAFAQSGDSLANNYHFRYKQLIVPTVLTTVGTLGLTSDWLEARNRSIDEELTENIDKKITIDDFTQYAPLVSVYALNICGLKGEHSMRDYTVLLATSSLMMGVTVLGLKAAIREQRPDKSDYNSFPSGHTATAFMGAELLRHEYWKVSPWIGIAGYVVAAGTGFFRMYNNRHWFTDVLAGAGIGILSAKASYWLFPYISKKIFKKKDTFKAITVY
jgi:membrane-associated phospholipid phosphatase